MLLPRAPRSVCGNPTGRGIPFVLGGEVVRSAEDVPWHAVVFGPGPAGSWQGICGGSLVTTNFIVSGERVERGRATAFIHIHIHIHIQFSALR